MRSQWSSLRESYLSSIRTLEAEQAFKRIQAGSGSLRRFTDHIALLAFLQDRQGDLDEKDRVYADLVRAAQRGGDLAEAVLWLGLWPGLDAVFRRQLRWVRDPGELASEVYWHFTRQVRRMDLGRVARVAATLVRNTERDLVRARRRTRESEALEETDLPACSPVEPDLLTSAIERLLSVVDARLVLGSVTEGREWEQLAEDCGLSVAAARKRVQRALARTRTSLAGSVSTGHSWPSRCAQ